MWNLLCLNARVRERLKRVAKRLLRLLVFFIATKRLWFELLWNSRILIFLFLNFMVLVFNVFVFLILGEFLVEREIELIIASVDFSSFGFSKMINTTHRIAARPHVVGAGFLGAYKLYKAN